MIASNSCGPAANYGAIQVLSLPVSMIPGAAVPGGGAKITSFSIVGNELVIKDSAGTEFKTPVSSLIAQSIPFSSAVKFDRISTVHASPVVTGSSAPIAFTVDSINALPGATTIVEVMSNGSNTPTFAGIKVIDGNEWDPRPGILNMLQFVYVAPGDVWVAIVQETNATPTDIVAPTLLGAVIPNAAPSTIVLTFSEALSGTAPAASAFAVSGNTVSSVAVSGSTVTLTVGTPFTGASTGVAVSYTKPATNPIKDAAGNETATLTGQAVTNQVSGTIPLTFTPANRVNVVNTGTDYTGTGAIWGSNALASQSLPANADGWVSVTQVALGTNSGSVALGLKKTNTTGSYATIDFGMYISNANNTFFDTALAAAIPGSPTTVVNQQFRIRRAAGVITGEYFNGTSWVNVKTWAENYQGALYVGLMPTFPTTSIARDPQGFGVI